MNQSCKCTLTKLPSHTSHSMDGKSARLPQRPWVKPPSFASIVADEEKTREHEEIQSAKTMSEDEELQLALAISASMCADGATEAAQAADKAPANIDSESESLALAMALEAQERADYEDFVKNNRAAPGQKVRVAYFRGGEAGSSTGVTAADDEPERFGQDDSDRHDILYGGDGDILYGGDGDEQDESAEEFSMNGSSGRYQRCGDNVLDNATGRVVSKHDPDLAFNSNAAKLMTAEGNVGNKAFNAFMKRRSGHKKVTKAASSRATSNIALDDPALREIEMADDKSVAYHDSDFSFEELEEDGRVFLRSVLSSAALSRLDGSCEANGNEVQFYDAWETFHSTHCSAKFFKPKRYLPLEFSAALEHLGRVSEAEIPTLLEVGCGAGAAFFPILDSIKLAVPAARSVAIDCSPRAIELLRENERFDPDSTQTFVCNIGKFIASLY